MCGRQPGPKSPNLKKVLEEAFHPFRKRHTASLRSNGIGNTLFAQVTAEEWVTRIQVHISSEGRHLARRVRSNEHSLLPYFVSSVWYSDSDRQTKFFQLLLSATSFFIETATNSHPLAPNSLKRDTAQKPRREGPSSISFCPSFPIQGARAIRNRNILCCNVFP